MKELDIAKMSLEQKIGQLIVVRSFKDEEDKNYILDMVKKGCVGGVQMWNTDEYQEFIAEVKTNASYPILICADMEWGYIGGKLKYPYAIGISSLNDPEVAYNLGRATAVEAKKDGVNVCWGPVLDIANEGALCKISRCFADNVETVSEFAVSMIKGFQDEGMIVTAKHFPGGSDITSDCHINTEASKMTEEELLNKDLIPYLNAMKEADLTGIMTGHVLFENIDNKYIASLSKKVIDIIRKQGFDGIIMTDSLAMMAIVQNYGEKECLGLAINAGNDMVLPNYRLTFKESFEYLLEAYNNKVFSEERLNDAVRHVLNAQHKTLKNASLKQVSLELEKSVDDANKKCITAIVKDGYDIKLSDNSKKLFVLLSENKYEGITGSSRELVDRNLFSYEKVLEKKKEILKEFPNSEVIILNEFPHYLETEAVCKKIAEYDETVFFTFCLGSCYVASDGITERVENIINLNKEKISAVIHIGNPYEVKKFKDIKRVINVPYGAKCDKYIYETLKGNFVPCGKFPVDLSL